MRRHTFYSLVAFFAFGGCFGCVNVFAQTVSIKTSDNPKYAVTCKDKNLLMVWDKIKNEFAEDSTEYLNEFRATDCTNLFEAGKAVDLNGDGRAEIIVHQIASCPASGNCGFWVFQKDKANGYKSILGGDEIQLFTLKKTKTNGYTDIQLRTHNSAASHYYQLFKFNGKKYTPQKCWWEDYMIPDKNGNYHKVKKPQIHFEKCGEYNYVN